jgi:hypothetical protein
MKRSPIHRYTVEGNWTLANEPTTLEGLMNAIVMILGQYKARQCAAILRASLRDDPPQELQALSMILKTFPGARIVRGMQS